MGCMQTKSMAISPESQIERRNSVEFKSRVFRKRKLSDTTLERVLQDPFVNQKFREFLRGCFGERKLALWLEIESFHAVEASDQPALGLVVYNRYFKNKELVYAELSIDAPTVAQCEHDLGILFDANGDALVGENSELVPKAFNLITNKLFQELKFEYLGEFLVSSYFDELRGESGYFKDVDDAAMKTALIMEEMNGGYILAHPLGQHYFFKFVNEHEVMGGRASVMVDLLAEIFDIQNTTSDSNHRRERMVKIVTRYGGLTELDALQSVMTKLEEEPGWEADTEFEVAVDILDATHQQVIAFLSAYIEPFKKSHHFSVFTNSIKSGRLNSKIEISETRKKTSTAAIEAADKFAKQRNLSASSTKFTTMEEMLSTTVGICYIKRYATQRFMEEHLFFWIEAQNFKEGRFEEPSFGTHISFAPEEDFTARRLKRANRIYIKYVAEDCVMPINISQSLKEDIATELGESVDIANVFDKAAEESFKLLNENLWDSFKKTPTFELLRQKLVTKDMKKSIQLLAST